LKRIRGKIFVKVEVKINFLQWKKVEKKNRKIRGNQNTAEQTYFHLLQQILNKKKLIRRYVLKQAFFFAFDFFAVFVCA
jgi:hypothetical protein